MFLYLFLVSSHFGFSLIGQNLKNTDTFTSVIVEVEKKILHHDDTIRVLTEYFQQDTPVLKVVALVREETFELLYTVDILKQKFGGRGDSECVSWYPTFTALENLRIENSKDVINFVKMFQEEYPDQQATILADFSFNDDLTHKIDLNRAINTLENAFIKANVNIIIFPYKPLNKETLEKHITNVAENIGQTFSQIQIDNIKRHLIQGNTNRKRKAFRLCDRK